MAEMGSLKSFTIKMDKLSVKLGTSVEKVKRATAIAVHQTITVATPVKTGRAKNNWNAELNRPNRTKILGEVFDKSGQIAVTKAKAVINQSNDADSIWISNNLDYIVDLNNGSSKKAPAGFVQKGIQTAVNFIKKAKVI
jgi:hypothetical protein